MRAILTAMFVALAAIAWACSEDDAGGDSVLHLPRGDVSESEYRSSMRSALLDPTTRSLCAGLAGLSGEEAARALNDAQIALIVQRVPEVDESQLSAAELQARLASIEAAQTEVSALATGVGGPDIGRAGEILIEECVRVAD